MGQEIPGAFPRVLVVDDDDSIREIAAAFVEDLGYGVKTAPNAYEALSILQTDRKVTTLLSDIGMPGMDGEELADRARALRPGLHVVLTSGAQRPRTDVAFVPKPFHAVDLINVLPPLPREAKR